MLTVGRGVTETMYRSEVGIELLVRRNDGRNKKNKLIDSKYISTNISGIRFFLFCRSSTWWRLVLMSLWVFG